VLRLLSYLVGNRVATVNGIPEYLDEGVQGLPKVTDIPCQSNCSECVNSCPTDAISLRNGQLQLDRGACIGCGDCLFTCPTGTLTSDRSSATFAYSREELVLSASTQSELSKRPGGIFRNSLSLRVVSTGCSVCDLEISAAFNPIFDADRFGISIVASPRFADALLVTGPVPKAMHEPLRICYESMAAPRIVIACGTCAISGGVHKGGYSEANGVSSVLPVDINIPGCSPHPWQIIQGLLAAKKMRGETFRG
jgi:formate hydrogenlyase subunit 7